jgi:hypothetical protein
MEERLSRSSGGLNTTKGYSTVFPYGYALVVSYTEGERLLYQRPIFVDAEVLHIRQEYRRSITVFHEIGIWVGYCGLHDILCSRASGAVTMVDFEYTLESVSWERRDSLLDIRRGDIELEGVSENCWRLKIYKTDWLLRDPYFGPILILSTTENQQHLQQPPLPPSCASRYRPQA